MIKWLKVQKFLSAILLVILFSCNHHSYKYPHILIETSYGDIEAELYPDKAPTTVAAFLSYIDSGYFNNSSFYRVILNEDLGGRYYGLIQGGVWQTNNKLRVPGIPHESTKQTGLTHTSGTLSLARTTPGSASTEFFICVGDNQQFDFGNEGVSDGQGYAAFGTVVQGMDVVRQIHKLPSNGENFTEKVAIKKIKRLN